ncbi:AMP-binding enzyme domain-containing protein [Phthorimaea operculella]|nr:AMP-binding enzyme domain-containing protein [Phthorimaea operculella]
MFGEKRVTDACRWYMEELSSRVVAESGRACDRFHLGKLILRGLKDAPDFTLQIDGSTGESASFASVLERSVQCASAFKQLGLAAGDVIVMMAPNNINMCVPFYAALYLGVLVSPIDRLLKIKELKDMFLIAEPKIVFCTTDRVKDVQTGLDELKLKSKIVTMDVKSEHTENAISIDELLKKFGAKDNVQDFKPTDLDPEENIALLISTSGTTGLPKQACHTHKTFTVAISGIWSRESSFPSPFKTVIIISPMQWLSCVLQMIAAPIYRYTLLTSQMEIDKEHFYDLVNKYRPNNALCSPTKLATLVEPGTKDKCDMSCFKLLLVGGSAVSAELLKSVQEVAPNSEIFNAYGITEAGSNIFMWGSTVHNSVGVPDTHLQYQGYYKNEEATKNAFSEDGWYKTGDLLYRDEQNNFFFVDRLKMLFKYMNHQISPVEIQNVILQHPGVQDVAVTSVADQRGDLPVACVVRKPGHSVTAQEIKDLVKDSLSDSKQLRGGVVFMDKLPVTATTKVNYRELKKIVLEVERE